MERIVGFDKLFWMSSYKNDSDVNCCFLMINRNIFSHIRMSFGERQLKLGDGKTFEPFFMNEVRIDFSLNELKQTPIVFHLFEDINDVDRAIYIYSDEKGENIVISGWSIGAIRKIIFFGRYEFPNAKKVYCAINSKTRDTVFSCDNF